MTGKYAPVALPDVPFAREMQTFCLSLEGAWEDYPWGDVIFKVGKKMFAGLGGSPLLSVTAKASPDDAEVLTQMPFIQRAAYVGRYGWVTVTIADQDAFDLARDLVAESYRLVAPKKRAARES